MDKLVKCSKCGSDAYIDKIHQGESRFKVYYNSDCDYRTTVEWLKQPHREE